MNPKFIILNRKAFTRLVLAFEVLPSSIAFSIEGRKLLEEAEVRALIGLGAIDSKHIIIELATSDTKLYWPIKLIQKVMFVDLNSLENFKLKAYSNYDVESFELALIGPSETPIITGQFLEPEVDFNTAKTDELLKVDAFLGLIFEELCNGSLSENELLNIYKEDKFPELKLLGVDTSDELQVFVAQCLMHSCLKFNNDIGWNANEILNDIINTRSEKLTELTQWLATVDQALTGDLSNAPFMDGGKPALRAAILVLLNPEPRQIKALKANSAIEVGGEVESLAIKFATLRFGFSYLDHSKRNQDPSKRSFLDDFRASILNKDLHSLTPSSSSGTLKAKIEAGGGNNANSVGTSKPKEPELGKLPFEDRNCLSWLEEDNAKSNETIKVYRISGLNPKAGCDLSLHVDNEKNLKLMIVDASRPKAKMIGPSAALKLLKLQASLPTDSRFEADDSNLWWVAPEDWWEADDMKEGLVRIIKTINDVERIANKSPFLSKC